MKHYNIYILILLCMSISISASLYDYRYVTNMKTEITPANDSFGTIVFTPILTNLTTYSITKNNLVYQPLIINANDIVKLDPNLTTSLMINSQILTTTNSISFPNAGVYLYYEVVNPNVTGMLTVVNLTYPTIHLQPHYNNLIDLTFDINDFQLNQEKVVNIISKAGLNLMPDTNYPVKFVINNTQTNRSDSVEQNVKMKRYVNWDVDYTDFMQIVQTGQHGKMGMIKFTNQGNTFSTITIAKEGALKELIMLPESVLIYPNVENKIDVMYTMEQNTNIGYNNTVKIFLNGESITKQINLTFDVFDNIVPEFRDFEIPDEVNVNRDTEFTCTFWDNHGIVNITSTLKNIQFDQTLPVEFTKQSDGKYRAKFKVLNVGDHRIEVCIYDASNNFNCTTKDFKVAPINIIESQENFKFNKVRINLYSPPHDLYFTPRDETVQIQLITMTYNGSWSLRLTDADGSENFIENVGEKVVMKGNGTIKMSFRGSSLGEYNGELRILPPDYHVPVKNTIFSGIISNYTVPNLQEIKWYNNATQKCKPYDSGDLETSYLECCSNYPLVENIETLTFPVTLDQKAEEQQKNEEIANNLKSRISWRNWIIGFLSVTLAILILLTWYVTLVYPNTRFRFK